MMHKYIMFNVGRSQTRRKREIFKFGCSSRENAICMHHWFSGGWTPLGV